MNAEDIRTIRKSYRLTQAELARVFMVSQQCIYNWERGLTNPTRFDYAVLEQLEWMMHEPISKDSAFRAMTLERTPLGFLTALFGDNE